MRQAHELKFLALGLPSGLPRGRATQWAEAWMDRETGSKLSAVTIRDENFKVSRVCGSKDERLV